MSQQIHLALKEKHEYCEPLKHIENILYKAKLVKKREKAKLKEIEKYNKKVGLAPATEDKKPKMTLDSIMSQIKQKNDKIEEKKNEKVSLSAWRTFEKEKEEEMFTEGGKLKFDEFDFDDKKEKKNQGILNQELDTLDDDNELTLLRKRKQFMELSGKR